MYILQWIIDSIGEILNALSVLAKYTILIVLVISVTIAIIEIKNEKKV